MLHDTTFLNELNGASTVPQSHELPEWQTEWTTACVAPTTIFTSPLEEITSLRIVYPSVKYLSSFVFRQGLQKYSQSIHNVVGLGKDFK